MKPGKILYRVGLVALAVCAAAVAFAQKHKVDLAAELAAMADTERAFARTCGEKGIPASFYDFFSPEGVAFNPTPQKFREAAGNAPPPANPGQFLLEWEPMLGDIAQSADLGWLTGPTRITDRTPQNRPPRSGFYSSVWKKQPDGTWRVQIDLGIRTPLHDAPLARNQFTRVPQEKIGKARGGAGVDSLRATEKALAASAAAGVTAAYQKWMAPSLRIHRNEHDPLTTSAAIRDYLATQPQSGAWETLHTETSAAADLGYTYGSYELKKGGATAEKGYYMRVWKRNPHGEWRLVFDVTSPLRPQ